MSGRKTEPESVRDMWWAQEQIAGNVKVAYKSSNNEPEKGALRSTEVSVRPSKYEDVIEVRKEAWYYGCNDDGKGGWPLRIEVEWSQEMSFEQFRASEWWEPYLERTKYKNFDSSWMDSFQVEHDPVNEYAEVSMRLPSKERVWWCSSEVPTGSTVEYFVYVCGDGTMGITRGNEPTVERSIDEILAAVRFAELMEQFGVSISEDGSRIVIEKGEGNAD